MRELLWQIERSIFPGSIPDLYHEARILEPEWTIADGQEPRPGPLYLRALLELGFEEFTSSIY